MSHSFARIFAVVAAASAVLPFVHAFNLTFAAPPTQCSNLTLSWTGGTAPYEVLIVPVGHVKPEIRRILDYQGIATTSTSFTLNFPAKSQFIAVVSDASGPASGATTEIMTVQSSPTGDHSCLGTVQVQPEFYFYLDPALPSQCDPISISWQEDKISSYPPSVWAVIPGGPSFAVPPPTANSTIGGPSFDWDVSVKAGTQVVLVVGDSNGRGKGGSTDLLKVGDGHDGASCLAANNATLSSVIATSTATSSLTTTSTSTSSPATTSSSNNAASITSPAHHLFLGALALAAFFSL